MQSKKRRFSRTASVLAVLAALALGPGVASSPAAANGVPHHASNSHHGAVNTHHGGRPRHFGTGVHAGAHHGNILTTLAARHVQVQIHPGSGHGHQKGHRVQVFGYRTGHHPGLRLSYGHGRHAFGRACHAVSKIGHLGHGRKANIGGTMCYDGHGVPYIIAGSRYIIHYY